MSKRPRLGYREIGDYYEHLILTGELSPGERLPAEEDLARQHHVTRTTIRRAFALLVNKGLVTKRQGRGTLVSGRRDVETRQREHVLIASFRTMEPLEHGGQIWPRDVRYRFGYLEAIVDALGDYARPFRIEYIHETPADVDALAERMRQRGDIGLVTFDLSRAEVLDRFLAIGVPVVLLDSVPHGRMVDMVFSDDRAGMKQATEHLLKTVRGPLAFLGTPSARWPSGPNRERFEGFLDAHRESDRPLPPEESIFIGEWVDTSSARRATRKAMSLPVRPRGIVCCTDVYAAGVLDELRTLDVHVPADVSVMGFGDILSLYSSVPTLSTVGVDRYQMGRLAVDLLERRLSGPDAPTQVVTVPMHLLLRQSCPPLLSAGYA